MRVADLIKDPSRQYTNETPIVLSFMNACRSPPSPVRLDQLDALAGSAGVMQWYNELQVCRSFLQPSRVMEETPC